ncbi:hypothetical protein [Streptomyces sp. NPDC097981]|uniref:hypothetical protein n=1 Tax=Streptomyces sp. NPDC097981 TaxID=3155428 RepID=UPI003326A14F
MGDLPGARRAVDDVRTLAEQLDGPESADTWFGYPAQKHYVHLSQVYTLLGDTRAAYRAQDDALALTSSPSVMTRALVAMDTAACLRVDGDPGAAAEMAAAVYDRLPERPGAPPSPDAPPTPGRSPTSAARGRARLMAPGRPAWLRPAGALSRFQTPGTPARNVNDLCAWRTLPVITGSYALDEKLAFDLGGCNSLR